VYESVVSYGEGTTFKEKLYLYLHQQKMPKCLGCGGSVKYKKMGSGFLEFCSRTCMHESGVVREKIKKTNIEKYGMENPLAHADVRDKIRNTNMQKYGVESIGSADAIKTKIKKTNKKKYGYDYPLQSQDIRDKANETIKSKYGVDNPMKDQKISKKSHDVLTSKYGGCGMASEEIKSKIAETNTQKYGVPNVWGNAQVRDKMHETNITKYGTKYPIQNKSVKNKMQQSLLKKTMDIISEYGLVFVSSGEDGLILSDTCGHQFSTNMNLLYHRKKLSVTQCTECNRIGGMSGKEDLICDFLDSIGIEYVRHDRNMLGGKEIDILIPGKNIGIEINGIYWHSSKFKQPDYHQRKKKLAHEKGINLINIWEDDIENKIDIIKSRLLNLFGLIDTKIYARSCTVSELTKTEASAFLSQNHIQGTAKSSTHHYGLVNGSEIVAVMSFGKLRAPLGKKHREGHYELLRFSSKLGSVIPGGASRLFNEFVKKTDPSYILSYSDLCWSKIDGGFYEKLGMSNCGITRPGYYYLNNGVRHFRYKYRKSELVRMGYDPDKTEFEITDEMGLLRIFDCGNTRFVWSV